MRLRTSKSIQTHYHNNILDRVFIEQGERTFGDSVYPKQLITQLNRYRLTGDYVTLLLWVK